MILGTAVACATPQMSCGRVLEPGAPSRKQGPLPWWGLSRTYTPTEVICVVPLLRRVAITSKARLDAKLELFNVSCLD